MKKTNVAINRHHRDDSKEMRDSKALITHDSMPWSKGFRKV